MARLPKIYGCVPPTGDHSWEKNSRGLLEFLSQTRTWTELNSWKGISNPTVLRHALAWLEDRKRVRMMVVDDEIRWIAVGAPIGLKSDQSENQRKDHKGRKNHYLNPVIPKPPHVPSIPGFIASDQPIRDTLHDTDPTELDPSFLHRDTIPVSDTISETEGEMDHHSPISSIPAPNH